MADQGNKSKRTAADVWNDIDSHVASLVGQRVFYNHEGTKCLAFVTRAGFDRDTSGHITNTLVVFAPAGILYPVLSYLSSDRVPGSFALANDGDLTDSGKNPNPSPDPPLVEETDVLPGPPPAPQEGAPTKPLEGDTDGDGKLSNREKKNLKKEK